MPSPPLAQRTGSKVISTARSRRKTSGIGSHQVGHNNRAFLGLGEHDRIRDRNLRKVLTMKHAPGAYAAASAKARPLEILRQALGAMRTGRIAKLAAIGAALEPQFLALRVFPQRAVVKTHYRVRAGLAVRSPMLLLNSAKLGLRAEWTYNPTSASLSLQNQRSRSLDGVGNVVSMAAVGQLTRPRFPAQLTYRLSLGIPALHV